jgi:hypothetical protein
MTVSWMDGDVCEGVVEKGWRSWRVRMQVFVDDVICSREKSVGGGRRKARKEKRSGVGLNMRQQTWLNSEIVRWGADAVDRLMLLLLFCFHEGKFWHWQ